MGGFMQIRRNWIWIFALVIAWLFDLLFWKQAPGISFFIFVMLCLAGGALSAHLSGVRPDVKSLPLAAMILATAAVTFLRAEPFTQACAVLATLGLMMLLAATYRGGKWPLYSVWDYIAGLFRLGANAALHPALLPAEKSPEGAAPQPSLWRRWLPPLLRGLVLSIPVLLLFAALLASADAVFGKYLSKLFDLSNLPEYIFRLAYILIGAYLLVGVFLHAILASRDESVSPSNPPRTKPFLGFVEAAMVLAGSDLLFAAFVAVQFRYFFGGVQNILVEGYTYSEYARSGFGELVAVAFISLMLLLALGTITRREGRQRVAFSALGVSLVALVSVILVSAFQRLNLYENAYGFTGLRMYTHVFIVWLGLLLAAVAVLEAVGHMRYFPLAGLLAAFGFTLSLAILNVDNAIVEWNERSARTGQKLDTDYLTTLSDDAVPALLDLYRNGPASTRNAVGAGLSCRLNDLRQEPARSWQSFHAAHYQARQLLEASDVATKYPITIENGWEAKAGPVSCHMPYRD
jgi:hypothetical protein